VAALLVGLTVVWLGHRSMAVVSVRALAELGSAFYAAIVGTQLALVLLAAPAATAGTICLDKARGTLAHLLITDLSDTEIVLGKLAARLVPVVAFVCCVLPVMAFATLLGGIDPWALTGAFLITLAVGIFGCALALLLSVWGSKTHEVLMATYTVLALWLLAGPMSEGISWSLFGVSTQDWFLYTEPFALAFAPQYHPPGPWLPAQVGFSLVLLGLSAGMTVVAVRKVRPVAVRQMGQGARLGRTWRLLNRVTDRWEALWAWVRSIGFRSLPSPSLDVNPVLWREWHRKRPSRWTRVVWGLFIAFTSFFSLLGIAISLGGRTGEFTALVNAFSVSIGFLFVAVGAPTSLAEERVQGSLDVLMSTPISTRAIVWGKWWGAYRTVPWLAAWPVLVTLSMAGRKPGGFLVPFLMLTLVLAQGALLTSIGMFLATWFSRLARALTLTVAIHVFLTIGWVMLLFGIGGDRTERMGWTMASPFWGAGLLTVMLEMRGGPPNAEWYVPTGAAFWTLADAAVAGLILWATLALFDRCLGRVPARGEDRDGPKPLSNGPEFAGRALACPTGSGSRTP
jgi:ABC-type transport system involved in multi-copper enzyme maturation permease subunit